MRGIFKFRVADYDHEGVAGLGPALAVVEATCQDWAEG